MMSYYIVQFILFISVQSTHSILIDMKSYDLLHALLESVNGGSAQIPSPGGKTCPYGEGYSKTSPTGCAICPAGMLLLLMSSASNFLFFSLVSYSKVITSQWKKGWFSVV